MSTSIGAVTSHKHRSVRRDECPLSSVVASIGCPDFAERMLTFADATVGADHVAAYQMQRGAFSLITMAERQRFTSIFRPDLRAYEMKRQLKTVGADTIRVHLVPARHPCAALGCKIPIGCRQHIMIVARKNENAFFVSILRSAQRETVDDENLEVMRRAASILVSAIAKHSDVTENKPNLVPALNSLTEIERCLLAATDLSQREAEVCARILYGFTTYSIAIDLGIGKESVMTYRKRAYLRLGIGCQRELLLWYLALPSTPPSETHDDLSSTAEEISSCSSDRPLAKLASRVRNHRRQPLGLARSIIPAAQ